MPAENPDLKTVFGKAIAIESAAERAEFLDRACAGNSPLRAEVDELLGALEDAGSFMERPAAEVDATMDRDPSAVESPSCRPDQIATSPPVPMEGPGAVIGPYKLLQELGEGGMGAVHMAEQTEPVRRKVALKIIKPGMDSRQVIARFEAERQALALMDHQNIARVLDAGTTAAGRPYFVMELVKGVPITKYCDENRLTPRERLELFVPVCRAIQHAHQKGIIHRDIKPSNVLVTLYDGRPVPKVIDFGVAKATGQQLTERTMFTEVGQIVGTMEYMSPEQAEMNQLDIDTRSDVYALGVLLYELLTGSTPITKQQLREAGFTEMLRTIREREPPKPSTRLSESGDALPSISAVRSTDPARLSKFVRGELDWIVMKALEKDRARRYETASGFAVDVQRYLDDEPVVACPPSVRYRFGKFARRHRAVLATSGVVAAALIVGTTVSTWQAIRASRAESQAEENLGKEQVARRDAEAARSAESEQRKKAALERDRAIEAEKQAKEQRDAAEKARRKNLRQLYRSDMNLAQQAFDAGNIGRMNELLDKHRPLRGEAPDNEDLRGFEWYHWWQAGHLHRLRPWKGTWPTRRMFGSRNGTIIAFQQDGGPICICDGDSGVIRRWINPYIKVFSKGEFCVSADGSMIAVGTREGDLLIFKTETGELVRKLNGVHPPQAYWPVKGAAYSLTGLAVTFSPTAPHLLASGDQQGRVVLSDITSSESVATFSSADRVRVRCLAFSPDGSRLAGGMENNSVVVWDVEGKSVEHTLRTHQDVVSCIEFSPRGVLATGSYDGTVRLWDKELETSTPLRADGSVHSLAFSADGELLAVGTSGKTVSVWRVGPALATLIHTIKGHSRRVHGVAFGKDSNTIWSAAEDATIRVWDLSHCERFATVQGRASPHNPRSYIGTSRVAYAADGRVLFLDQKGAVHGWNVDTRSPTVPPAGLEPYVNSAVSDNGRFLAGITSGKELFVWDLMNHGLVSKRSISIADNFESSLSLVVAGDGQRVAWGSGELKTPETSILDLVRGTVKSPPLPGWPEAFSPNGERLTLRRFVVPLADPSYVTDLCDVTTDPPSLVESLSGFGPENCAVFSGDGLYLAIGSWNNDVRLYEASTGKLIRIMRGHTGEVTSVAFSSTGSMLVSGSADTTVRIWDTYTGELRSTFKGHDNTVVSVAFSPFGNSIASCSQDGTIKIWTSATKQDVAKNTHAWLDWAERAGPDDVLPILTAALEANPKNQMLLERRSKEYAQREQWEDAATDYLLLADLAADPVAWLKATSLLVRTGRIDVYRGKCEDIVARFSDLEDSWSAQRITRACLILPPSETVQDAISRLAERAYKKAPQRNWVRFAKSLADMRTGRYADAIQCAQDVLDAPKRDTAISRGLVAQCQFVQAISHHALGELDQARQSLGRGISTRIGGTPNYPTHGWWDSLIADALRREAESLINSKPNAAANKEK